MRKTVTIFSLLIAAATISASSDTQAQGRRNDNKSRDRSTHREHAKSNHERNKWKDQHNRRDDHHQHYERRAITNVYHRHDHYCNHAPAVVHHHHARPRYVYYRDYDVYYDIQRSVYVSYSGKSWTVSTAIPVSMRRVNVREARRFEVDYYDDDFPTYLERRRPSYVRAYVDW